MTDVPVRPPAGRSDPGYRQVLVLHGGGYRGLFTALILEAIEKEFDRRIPDIFDMVAGTSIGGIIALGLATGKSAETIRSAIETKGPALFPPRGFFGRTVQNLGRVFGAPHDQELLAEMIRSVLNNTDDELQSLQTSVVVPALDAMGTNEGPKPIVYSNHRDSTTREARLIDVALATSAAPTYLPSYTPENSHSQLVDGGVIANSPSWIALTTAIADYGWNVDKLRMLIVGTTKSVYGRVPEASDKGGKNKNREGFAYWLTKGKLFDLIMEGQQRLADSMCEQALGNERCFSINATRSPAQDRVAKALNQASDAATSTLTKLADDAMEEALANGAIRQLLNRRAQHVR